MPMLAGSSFDRTDARRRGRHTILVVDDEPTIRETIATILARAGYRVLLAADAWDAVSVFEQHSTNIDLILTDVWMPGLNGPPLLERLLSIQPRLKCVLMSANDRPASRRDVGFLAKPFSIHRLLRRIVEALEEE